MEAGLSEVLSHLDCDVFEMISSFCLQIMTGCITQSLFVDLFLSINFFHVVIHFLISSLPHYGLIKIKVVKKWALSGSHMSLLRICSILLLISEKLKTQSRENKSNSTDMESALRAAWLGLLLMFTVSQKLLYHQLWLLNLTLCHDRNEGCRMCTVHSVGT